MPIADINHLLSNVQYALAQLRSYGNHANPDVRADSQRRAIDALERVEAELKAPVSRDEEGE